MMNAIKARRLSLGKYGFGVIRANNLSLRDYSPGVSTAELLVRREQSEKAATSALPRVGTSFAGLRVVKIPLLGSNFKNHSSANIEVGRIP